MRKLVFVILVSCLLFTLLFVGKESIPPVKASPDVYQGDLVLTGNNVTVIEGRFDINGSIIVEENATLILRNAIVNFTQTENWEYEMTFWNPANGNPRLQALNSTLTSKFVFAVTFWDNSSAIIREITILKCDLEAFDYSTVNVLDSTVEDLWAYDYSVLTVTNSTITSTFRGVEYSTVSASNCTIYIVDAGGRSTINVSNSITHDLIPELESVNCSVTGLNPGLFQSWNSLQDCSVVEAADGFAPNITLLDTQILSWSLYFGGSSNATVHNSTLKYLSATCSSTLNMYNSTYLYPYVYDSARVYSCWYLGVLVVDSIDQIVPSANVTATYPNATEVESKLADANGWARFTLMEKMMNATGDYPVGNYTVEATYDIYSDATTVDMTENKQITLTLEDFVISEFPSFLIIPLFMMATLLAIIIYKRKDST